MPDLLVDGHICVLCVKERVTVVLHTCTCTCTCVFVWEPGTQSEFNDPLCLCLTTSLVIAVARLEEVMLGII